MDKIIIKKLLATMMIITILATDFFVLGSNLVTYATQINNEIEGYPNIHFSTYFKDKENETKQIEKSIKDRELKLYAKIGVNNDVDYLEDVQIKLKEDNFRIITSNKGSLEGNTVKLDYITAGTSTELELDVEPILSNKISADMLLKTNIELNAKYIHADAPKGEKIHATSEAIVKYQPDETTEAELKADIITNKVLEVDGTNQRLVQLLIKSRLTKNEFPVKQTTLNVTIPKLGEVEPKVSALVIGKLATNGETKINNMTTEKGELQITLNNEIDKNNQISWDKEVYDEIVVTYIYPETVDASKVEIIVNSEIKLHSSGNVYTAKYTKGIENKEPNSVIMGRTEIVTDEMYKGQLYANIDSQYETKTSIIVTKTKVAEEIKLQEGPDVLATPEGELTLNTKYVTTKINLEKMLDILGQNGNIEIKNGETTILVNKETTVDENGDVVINHPNSTSQLEITTSIPEKEGIIEINHTKVITENTYTREQLKPVTTLKAKGTIVGTITVNKEQQKIAENTTETSNSTLELKETTTKAEMTIDKTTLSATEANEVTVGIKLITDGEKYDLYKNPSISLKLPQAVENVEFIEEPSKLYADEFGVISKSYDKTNKIITISMNGEQTAYPESSLTQAFIQLKLKITLKQFALSQTDKITMEYTNGTRTGREEQEVQISSPSELIKMFNLSSNENTSLTEKVLQRVRQADAGKEFNFNIELLNNKDTIIKNIKILGKVPTTGNTITGEDENTLQTTLKGIETQNATIYYTENAEATEEIENSANGWTQNLSPNAKLYLIKLDSLARGSKYTANVAVQMSNSITENGLSYAEYEVIYDTDTATVVRENSRKIGLVSSAAASIKVETTAQVGQDILNNGDSVKEGEVIKYTVTVKNNGTETLQNVKLELDVPKGTVYVRPIPREVSEDGTIIEGSGYVYAEEYYEEITDAEKLAELTDIMISELPITTPYIAEYEVRVNKGVAGKEVRNKSTIIYDESSVEAKELKNIIEEAKVRVTINKTIDESIQLLANAPVEYTVYVENLSDSIVKNLELKIISNDFNVEKVNGNTETSKTIKIDEVKPKNEKGIYTFEIYGKFDANAKEISISAIVNDNGQECRSNVITEILPRVDATVNLSSQQNGQYIKEGDTVEYNFAIKNTGEIESIIRIKDDIPQYLQVQSIYVNKQLKLEAPISNGIDYPIVIKSQEQIQVNIICEVRYIPEIYHGKTITNMATISVDGVKDINAQAITHILKASSKLNENVENVISGMSWLDSNVNGRRDTNEEALSGVKVKLYDTLNNHYVSDEYGNVFEISTDNKGEYNFSKIKDGSYLLVFEYDTEKYEFTKSFAQGVETSLNSKVSLKQIKTEDAQIRVAAIEINDLKENIFNMNIGLKENTGETPKEEQPGVTEKDEEQENPTKPEQPEQPEQPKDTKTISGYAWMDSNRNGKKDENESLMQGVKVKIYDVTTKNYLKDNNGNIIETTTDNNGKYIFNNMEKGVYILIFEYDTEKYEPTTYMAEGVDSASNSKVVLNKINVNGKEETSAVTDTIKVEDNISNINIGLKEKIRFDIELNKYISRIVVQNGKDTKTYDYKEKELAKVEIHKKRIEGSLVVIEYTIKVKNNGDISGYVQNIIDYLPSGLTFSSELNKNWYLIENNLHTKSLENVELKPGEEKEVKIILTRTMTKENVGLINNRAEIYEDYNKYGEKDIDSTPNNQVQGEDDMNSVDIIIGISTGGRNLSYIMLLMINLVLIVIAIRLMIRNEIIKISTKRERR